MGKLSVYSASAGSGKTYTIAYEYISMMLNAVSDATFRNILAVTFTNKACDEMKSRIVLNLFQISNIDKATGDLKKKTEGIIDSIRKRTGLDEATIIKRSRKFFTQIIHDYSFFSVYTIDSFFQKIVRNLTYELGMQQNYELELNTNLVVSQLVDDIMLMAENDADLNRYISSMIEENIEADKKWSPKGAINNFISQTVASDFKGFECDIDAYEAEIDTIIDDYCARFRKNIEKIGSLISQNGLTEDDFYKRANYSNYCKLSNLGSNSLSCAATIFENFSADKFKEDRWFTKKSPNLGLADSFNAIISDIKDDYEKFGQLFGSAYVVKKNMNLMRLLAKATEILHENLDRESVFLLSDVPSLLSEIIKRSSDDGGNVSVMPFVFESIGTKYNNFMIDEFQDTGQQQWNIFRTMLHDALSQGNDSIVVGDIKQSIYSWRGGDWRILSELANSEDRLLSTYCDLKPLDKNHRTARNIVEFNNDFFYQEYKRNKSLFGDESVGSQFKTLYDDVWQGVTKNDDSEIKVSLYNGPYGVSDEVAMKRVFSDMVAEIKNLQLNHHVPPSKITILVRKKSEASFIANGFLELAGIDSNDDVRYDVVSDEALYIASNRAVRIILAYMRHILNGNDDISFVEAMYLYHLEKNNLETCTEFNRKNMEDAFLAALAPVENLSEKQSFEFVEILINRLHLNENDKNVPFLIAFRNVVHNFSEKSTDMQAFLDYWDERGFEETLKIPESQNAMKIITIHKSKGLEADYVFIPFCNWEFVSGGFGTEYLFVENPIAKDDSSMFLIPVECSKLLERTSMAAEYNANRYRKAIESYNLLYVAFTRAKYGLYISAYEKEGSRTSNSRVSCLLENYFSDESMSDFIVSPPKKRESVADDAEVSLEQSSTKPVKIRREGWEGGDSNTGEDSISVRIFTKGALPSSEEKKVASNNDFITEYPVCEKPQIDIVHHIVDKVEGDWSARVKGTKYHAIFERIVTVDDVEPAVAFLFNNGEIDRETYENLVSEFMAALTCEPVRRWFDGSCKVYNEFNIIDPNTEKNDERLKRPDRVMVFPDEVVILDYKFGQEKHDDKYARQVLDYGRLISKMKGFGGKKISQYVWYYFRKELAVVKSSDDISIKRLV